MDLASLLEIGVAGIVGLLALYGAFQAGVKALGAVIPGKDPVEKFGEVLDEKVAPIIAKIEDGVDLLNPKTNGGAGRGRAE